MRALARAATGAELVEVDTGIEAGRAGDGTAYYHTEDDPRAVGKALRWARSQELDHVHLLAGSSAGPGDLARRAALLNGAPITVWAVDGASAEEATPTPLAPAPELTPEHRALAGLISEAGALPVDDHGVLVAEVAGLEVARVIDTADGPALDIGVGQADRELNQMVHGGADPVTDLRRVIATVHRYRLRQPGHPLTRVARERWIRAALLDDPTPVGAAALAPIVPLRPRAGLKVPAPTAAAGIAEGGGPLVVVVMVGIDLDIVPEAAEYRAAHDPSADLVIAMPERDLALSTTTLEYVANARAVAVEGPWNTPRPM